VQFGATREDAKSPRVSALRVRAFWCTRLSWILSPVRIGDGYIVTARHVVEGGTIAEIVGHHYADHHDRITIRRTLYTKDGNADVAILETDFSLSHFIDGDRLVGGRSRRANGRTTGA